MTLLPDTTRSFAHDLARHGEMPALLDPAHGGVVTYLALQRRVDEAAERLGSETPRLVLLEPTNSVPTVATYLAALQQGHPVLLAPRGRREAVRRLVDAYDPDVVAVPNEGGELELEVRRDGTAHELHPDLALLLSTSGSTGSAKVVRLSHANLQANADAIATVLGIGPDDRAVTSLPMAYCYGLSVVHSHLAAGRLIGADRGLRRGRRVLGDVPPGGRDELRRRPPHVRAPGPHRLRGPRPPVVAHRHPGRRAPRPGDGPALRASSARRAVGAST